MLEHLNNTKRWNIGYNFGMGFTSEKYKVQGYEFEGYSYEDKRGFMSISAAGILSYKAGERSNIRLSPMVLWTDPINTFKPNYWVPGGEDISFLVLLGFEYRLK